MKTAIDSNYHNSAEKLRPALLDAILAAARTGKRTSIPTNGESESEIKNVVDHILHDNFRSFEDTNGRTVLTTMAAEPGHVVVCGKDIPAEHLDQYVRSLSQTHLKDLMSRGGRLQKFAAIEQKRRLTKSRSKANRIRKKLK